MNKGRAQTNAFQKTIATTMEIQRWDIWFSQQYWIRNHTDWSFRGTCCPQLQDLGSPRRKQKLVVVTTVFSENSRAIYINFLPSGITVAGDCYWYLLLENVWESTQPKSIHTCSKNQWLFSSTIPKNGTFIKHTGTRFLPLPYIPHSTSSYFHFFGLMKQLGSTNLNIMGRPNSTSSIYCRSFQNVSLLLNLQIIYEKQLWRIWGYNYVEKCSC